MSKILHVEDDLDIQAIAQIALETIGGFEILQCSSGQEALKAAPDFKPDLFLLDVMMPGMTGPETLAALRELPGMADVPAIFMTAKAQRDEVAEFLALGAIEVVVKPFEPMELANEIRAAWERHQQG
ncbi:MAG: response regulator [Paracoccaceae bacterium]|nr:response regulator [Paracoccaceae bacterium]